MCHEPFTGIKMLVLWCRERIASVTRIGALHWNKLKTIHVNSTWIVHWSSESDSPIIQSLQVLPNKISFYLNDLWQTLFIRTTGILSKWYLTMAAWYQETLACWTIHFWNLLHKIFEVFIRLQIAGLGARVVSSIRYVRNGIDEHIDQISVGLFYENNLSKRKKSRLDEIINHLMEIWIRKYKKVYNSTNIKVGR